MFPRAILIFTKIERGFFAIGQKPRHRRSCKTSGKLGDVCRDPSCFIARQQFKCSGWNFSPKLLDKGVSRRRVGKAPPKIGLGFSYNSPSVPHLDLLDDHQEPDLG
jgi:hypothetical protein